MANWTKQQREAFEAKGSVLVSASAGTGKTAVLTERVAKNILEDKVPIENILVMTFSSASADEMKERIRKRLVAIVLDENEKPGVKKYIWGELNKFGDSNIQTIHSFCKRLIQEYFYIVDVDPNFAIGDSIQMDILKLKAANLVLDEEYAMMEPDFMDFDSCMDKTSTLPEIIVNSANKLMSFQNYESWLREEIESYNIKQGDTPKYLLDMVLDDLDSSIALLEKAIEMLDGNADMNKNAIAIIGDMHLLQSMRSSLLDGDITVISPSNYTALGAATKFPTKDGEYDDVKAVMKEAKNIYIEKYKKPAFDLSAQINRIRQMYPIASKFEELILKYNSTYASLKKAKKVIDFNDMEVFASKILESDEISNDLKARYHRVFVDEYQDTSPTQEYIINRVSSEDSRFFVGDLKQSIYGFRASDPVLFKNRKNEYSDKTSGTVISLNKNFRSTQNVLNCSNDVFSCIVNDSKELSYDNDDTLVHGRLDDKKVNPVVFNIIPDSLSDTLGLKSDEVEAYNIVNIIKDEMSKTIYDHELGEERPVKYSDIVIACRNLSDATNLFAKVFTEQQIPFKLDRAGSLLSTPEANILFNILSLSDNIRDDVKLMSIIRAGVYSFDDEDLVSIRLEDKEKHMYENFITLTESDCVLGAKCKRLNDLLTLIKSMESRTSLVEIINYAIEDTKLFDLLAIMSDGRQRVANAKKAITVISSYEKNSHLKIKGFMSYLSDIREAGKNIEEAILDMAEDAISITTIHRSKGLEFPIEILAFMGKEFSSMASRSNIMIDKDAGIGFRYYDDINRCRGSLAKRAYIQKEVSKRAKEEEMRLLYVAMTRAQERLYIQATYPETRLISFDGKCKCMADWVSKTLITSGFDGSDTPSGKLTGTWTVKTSNSSEFDYIQSSVDTSSIEGVDSLFNLESCTKKAIKDLTSNLVPVAVSSSKLSVLRGGQDGDSEKLFVSPDFSDSSIVSAAQRGTINHRFMQLIDLHQSLDVANLAEQANSLIAQNKMSNEDLNHIKMQDIADTFNTDIGQLIKSADTHLKEYSMNILKDAQSLGYEGVEDDVLIRCIVDLIFKKGDKYYLVDYKTDKFKLDYTDDDIDTKVSRYHEQISLYKEAFFKTCGFEIEESYLLFTDINTAVLVN